MPWLFFVVLVDAIGFGIILPLLPIFALKFQLDVFQLGILTAIFSLAQFITAPILGAISDKLGRKKIIVFCLACIGLSYALMAYANSFFLALVARAIAGTFTGNISVTLASASDLSTDKTRTTYMGYIGAASGIGFILGPIIGGFLAGDDAHNADLKLVFQTASIFTLVASVLAGFFLKETLDASKVHNLNILRKLKRITTLIVNNKSLMFLIYLSIFMWFGFAAINVFLATWALTKFELSPKDLGLISTLFAFFAAIIQISTPRIFKGGKAILLGFQISAFATFLMILDPNFLSFIFIIILLATGIGLLFPNLNSTISFYGSNYQKGFILGLSQSAGMLGQTLGPLLVGWSYANFSVQLAWIIIASSFFLASIITLQYMLRNRKT